MTDKNTSIYARYFEKNDKPFFMKIGNTTYEVSTHFNPKSRENVLQQFEDLLTELKTLRHCKRKIQLHCNALLSMKPGFSC